MKKIIISTVNFIKIVYESLIEARAKQASLRIQNRCFY
jgi:hypothetical protein